jgi:hypothetical protein
VERPKREIFPWALYLIYTVREEKRPHKTAGLWTTGAINAFDLKKAKNEKGEK